MKFQTGEIIRTTPEKHYYWDVHNPKDGIAYAVSKHEYIIQVPEMLSSKKLEWCYFDVGEHKSSKYRSDDISATGETQWLQFTIKDLNSKPIRATNLRILPVKPNVSQYSTMKADDIQFNENPFAPQIVGESQATAAQLIASAPFEYAIDPVLSVSTTIVTYAGMLVITPVMMFLML